MKRYYLLTLFALMVTFLTTTGFIPPDDKPKPEKYSYVGTEVCGMCHKTEAQGNQLTIWKNSKHSRAYETLLSSDADKIAKDLGYDTPAAETHECLRCHTSGHDTDKEFIGARFKLSDGVQCETCHGPGSGYKDMKIMKSKEESVKHGLIVHENIAAYCTSCHNAQSPTFVELNFDEAWKDIAHPITKKNE